MYAVIIYCSCLMNAVIIYCSRKDWLNGVYGNTCVKFRFGGVVRYVGVALGEVAAATVSTLTARRAVGDAVTDLKADC